MSHTDRGLFGDDPALDPTSSPDSRMAAIRQIRREGYALRLYDKPPIKSCDCYVVGGDRAKAACANLAKLDEKRMADAEADTCLTVIGIERLAALEKALADWLKLAGDDIATGGNGSEDIDSDELSARTQTLLDSTTLRPFLEVPTYAH